MIQMLKLETPKMKTDELANSIDSHEVPDFFDRVFSFQKDPKNLDPSYKMDLDHWDCLGGVKSIS